MNKYILKQDKQDGYDLFRIPGLICTGSGKLLAYYECRKSDSDWASIDIAVRSSQDGGKTWSSDKILVYGHGKTVNNPVMFAGKEEILFMWQEEYRYTFYRKSFDEGETWSDTTEITASLKSPEYNWTTLACGPGHGTVLSSGRYIVPVWLCSNPKDLKAHHPSILSTVYSNDKGATWHLGELIDKEYMINPSETALAELADGSVIINIRSESPVRRRILAYSRNGYKGWNDIHFEAALPDPVCMGSMTAHNGKVYFVNCNSEKKRKNLTLYETTDNGVSWKNTAVLSESAGYSDIAVSPDGKYIYILFEEFFYQNSSSIFAPLDRSKRQNLVFITLKLSAGRNDEDEKF